MMKKIKKITGAQKTKFKTLENYINNRDEILTSFSNELGCSKGDIKNLFNILTNGGSYKAFKLKNNIITTDKQTDNFIKSFQCELLTLSDVISNNNHDFHNNLIIKSREDEKDIENINTTTTSMYYYTVERVLLEHAIEFFDR